MLKIKNLHVEIENKEDKNNVTKEILKGINLEIEKGKIHALMGPNGSGKSTIANVIMGNPKYKITKGEIFFEGEKINELSPEEKAKKGIFMSFQYPSEIEGVTIRNFLKTAYQNLKDKKISILKFKEILDNKMKILKIKEDFSERYLNQGFSGGEKKKSEILQLSILSPKLAILDETDSGLDIDALKAVSEGINLLKKENPDLTILIITHYKRILNFIKPDKLSILINGKIAMESDSKLVDELEEKGYGWIEED